MSNVCRTCGFSDCPGANGGQCPRWPARDTSDLDLLTLAELYDLHHRICADGKTLNDRMMYDDLTPKIAVFSDEWNVLSAKSGEVYESAAAVYAEITRREEESAGTRALRDLRNQRGIDA